MENIEIEVDLSCFQKSSFRRRFFLSEEEKRYVEERGLAVIRRHAYEFIEKRLLIRPPNDGKQTPFRGHPVFVAQHATATCCRQCLFKWHKIPPHKPLSSYEKDYIVSYIMAWIEEKLVS